MKLICFILSMAWVGLGAMAQTPFRTVDGTEELVEGGTVHTLTVESGTQRMTLRVPKGFSATVDKDERSVVFHEDTGIVAVTMKVTTNSPGAMPDDQTLRGMALAIDPYENFLQLSSCASGYKPARFVDSIHGVDAIHNVRTRQAFVACPDGLVEFVYSSKDEEFEKGRIMFNLFVSSFRLQRLQTTGEKSAQ